VSITDRRRELGVLRAVGGLRGQVRRTIWLEALAIGLIGLLLGLAMGAVIVLGMTFRPRGIFVRLELDEVLRRSKRPKPDPAEESARNERGRT